MAYMSTPGSEEDSSSDLGVSVSVAAARLGVTTSTLRSWGNRYGLVPSLRTVGGHRRYSPNDLLLLDAVQAAVTDGVPPALAAATALAGTKTTATVVKRAERRRRGAGPGGRVLGVPGADSAARGLARAASQLDLDGAEDVVLRGLRERGVLHTWDELLRPVLIAAGARWAEIGDGIEVEHVLSEATLGALRRRRAELPAPEGGPAVLIASAPGDPHSLPLHAVAVGLGERGCGSRVIGAQVPFNTLASAIRRTRPAAVFVSCVLPGSTSAQALVAELPRTRPRTPVVVGGQGWAPELPPELQFAPSLRVSLDLLEEASLRARLFQHPRP